MKAVRLFTIVRIRAICPVQTEKLSDVLKRAFWVDAGAHRLGQQLRAALETGRANLHFDGRPVRLSLTPADLQLEDGDILDLYL